jgi:hypothetical protein
LQLLSINFLIDALKDYLILPILFIIIIDVFSMSIAGCTVRKIRQFMFASAFQARLWMQVIQELRTGVQLKKVQAGGPACLRNPTIEYELTPYEILMDDIRARRYKLNKVSNTRNYTFTN